MAAATQSSLPPNLHLRNINTHVAASLESNVGTYTDNSTQTGTGSGSGQWMVPRQQGPGTCLPLVPPSSGQHTGASKTGLVGTSGFAFQGTNAHVLLSASPFSPTPVPHTHQPASMLPAVKKWAPASLTKAQSWNCLWQPQSLWMLPPSAQLAQRALLPEPTLKQPGISLGHTREAVFETLLVPSPGARLAWLYDHLVITETKPQCCQAIVPAAAYCDAAASALEHLLCSQQQLSKAQGMAAVAVLEKASIPRPLVLPEAASAGSSTILRYDH
eukprot:scaffold107241_cov14-Tisochrysis_lutea.AAC.2